MATLNAAQNFEENSDMSSLPELGKISLPLLISSWMLVTLRLREPGFSAAAGLSDSLTEASPSSSLEQPPNPISQTPRALSMQKSATATGKVRNFLCTGGMQAARQLSTGY